MTHIWELVHFKWRVNATWVKEHCLPQMQSLYNQPLTFGPFKSCLWSSSLAQGRNNTRQNCTPQGLMTLRRHQPFALAVEWANGGGYQPHFCSPYTRRGPWWAQTRACENGFAIIQHGVRGEKMSLTPFPTKQMISFTASLNSAESC